MELYSEGSSPSGSSDGSEQSASVESIDAFLHCNHPDYVRVLLLSADLDRVLMVSENNKWDLPYFEYRKSSDHLACVALCCRDLQKWFQISKSDTPCFTAVVELLGDATCHGKDAEIQGREKLILMEYQLDECIEDLPLPKGSDWKAAEFLSSLLSDFSDEHLMSRRSMEVVRKFMHQSNESLFDPRYHFGWFQKASNFLVAVVSSDGAQNIGKVTQEQLSTSSTILTVKSSKGQYFLKAPSRGSTEVAMTFKVRSLFPRCSAVIVRTCEDLNCFVTKGFNHSVIPRDEMGIVVQKLGHLQLASLSSLNEIKATGCRVRDMHGLARKINSWMKGEGIFRGCKEETQWMIEVGPKLLDMCQALVAIDIPLTLCHGDFSLTNVTYEPAKTKNVLIFDWEYAHVGHPFCDLHRIDNEAPQKVVDDYVRLWRIFGISLAQGRRAYDLARKLGWVVRMWALEDTYELRNHELCSSARSVFFQIMRGVHHGLELEHTEVERYACT